MENVTVRKSESIPVHHPFLHNRAAGAVDFLHRRGHGTANSLQSDMEFSCRARSQMRPHRKRIEPDEAEMLIEEISL